MSTQDTPLTGTKLYEYQVGSLLARAKEASSALGIADRFVHKKAAHATAWGHPGRAADMREVARHLDRAQMEIERLSVALRDAVAWGVEA